MTFHRYDDTRSKVMLQLDFEPEGFVESAGDALGFVKRRAAGDLRRFKEFIETQGRLARRGRQLVTEPGG